MVEYNVDSDALRYDKITESDERKYRKVCRFIQEKGRKDWDDPENEYEEGYFQCLMDLVEYTKDPIDMLRGGYLN